MPKPTSLSRPKIILAAIILAVISFWAGYAVKYLPDRDGTEIADQAACRTDYRFLNPLSCRMRHTIDKKEYRDLRDRLVKYITARQTAGEVMQVSVMFRDLENGPTMGISERELFDAASLLKVPIMMAIYRKAEDLPGLLDRTVSYREELASVNQGLPPDQTLRVGESHTLDELIRRMIVYSDNRSKDTLKDYLLAEISDEDVMLQTYLDLGLVSVRTSDSDDTISLKSYSGIFRQLYHGSFLSLDMSEKALALLSESPYTGGLVAGVPRGIPVAHKFGERAFTAASPGQLHDCGIVYFPENPYLLCIMTRGKNKSVMEPVIRTISKMVYDEVGSRRID